MLTGKIRNQVDQVWAMFWTGGVANPISVIEQISYLLFIRRLDELQRTAERRSQATGLPLKNPTFSPEEQALRWNNFKDKDPDIMMDIVQNQVFPKIKTLHNEGSFAEHMKDAIFMIPSAKLLDQVVQLLSAINMDDKDTKGDLYEYLLSKLQQSGVNGQFRTPRNIIEMMVDLMQPKVGDTICDPSSGTCGFLMAAVEHVEENHSKEINKPDNRKHFNNEMFTGFDFDKHMLRIGAMNMLLHGIENPSVHYRDSLQDQGDENISEAYSEFLDEGVYNTDQIQFVNQVINYLVDNGVLDMAQIFEPPFTDQHGESAYGFFDEGTVVELFGVIRSVNANAVVEEPQSA